jgi:allantoinase
LLFEEAVLNRGLPAPRLAQMTARNVARRFRLEGKGELRAGADADIVILQKVEPRTIQAEELLTRHRVSAYQGRRTSVRVVTTIARGEIVHGPGARDRRGTARILRPQRLA